MNIYIYDIHWMPILVTTVLRSWTNDDLRYLRHWSVTEEPYFILCQGRELNRIVYIEYIYQHSFEQYKKPFEYTLRTVVSYDLVA